MDRARQIHVPVRIVRGVQQLRLGIDHLEGELQRLAVVHHLHRLGGEKHVAHVVARLLLEQRAVGRAHHVFVVEPLHQERYPGEPALDPDRLEARETLRHAVHHPVGEVQHVVPGEAERVHGDETIGHRQAEIGPVERGVERQRQVALLQRRVGLGVGVVVDAAIMRRGHHEADDALAVGEFQHRLVAGLGIVERQIEHRLEAIFLAKNFFAQPAVIGLRHRHLDLDPRAGRKIEHRGWKHAGDIDAHGVHPAPHQGDIAVRSRRDLLDPAAGIAGDAPADFLVRAVGRRDAATRRALIFGFVANDRILHVLQDLVECLGLVVVAVDVDDAEILVAALDRLVRRMRQQRGGIELGGGEVAEVIGVDVHRAILSLFLLSCAGSAGGRPATSPARRRARTPRGRRRRASHCSRSRRRSG